MDQAEGIFGQFINENQALRNRPNVVIREYPVNPQQFCDDVSPFVDEIIGRHGLEEWKSAVLTHEIHRHLGIYSIIGVKMGILAREILQADLDELIVESYAGYEPPISCMSDGLQVSTGASLGRGSIFVKKRLIYEPAAIFRKGDKKIKLVLKKSFQDQIDGLIFSLDAEFTSGTHEYFERIRNISINYWLELGRMYIFEVTKEINAKNNYHDAGD